MENNKIDWDKTTIIGKLNSGDEFHFLQHKQSHLKGRKFVFIRREQKNCFYSELNSKKELKTNWNRSVVII